VGGVGFYDGNVISGNDMAGHYCPVIDRAKMPNTPVVIDDYRSLDLLTI
jgi:hypothetical protein